MASRKGLNRFRYEALDFYLGNNATIALIGIEATGLAASINAQTDSFALVSGADSESQAQQITASTDQTENASVSISGLQLTSALGTVKAKVSKKKGFGGQTLVRPVSDKDGTAKVKPILAVALPSKVRAKGLTVQNVSAQVIPLQAGLNISSVQARGVLDIEDEEVLLLLVA